MIDKANAIEVFAGRVSGVANRVASDANLKGIWWKEFIRSAQANFIQSAPNAGFTVTASYTSLSVSLQGVTYAADTQLLGVTVFVQTAPSASKLMVYGQATTGLLGGSVGTFPLQQGPWYMKPINVSGGLLPGIPGVSAGANVDLYSSGW